MDDQPVLAMELAGGEDLAQRLLRGPISLDEALPIVRQIAVGVLERGERVVILAAGAIFNFLVLALWIVAIGSTITVIQRFAHAYREMEQIDADERLGLGERV